MLAWEILSLCMILLVNYLKGLVDTLKHDSGYMSSFGVGRGNCCVPVKSRCETHWIWESLQ